MVLLKYEKGKHVIFWSLKVGCKIKKHACFFKQPESKLHSTEILRLQFEVNTPINIYSAHASSILVLLTLPQLKSDAVA